MKLVTYQAAQGPRVAGVRADGRLVDLNQTDPRIPSCIKALLAQGRDGLERARAALEKGQAIVAVAVEPLPLIPKPDKIICIGLNYSDHAAETGATLPNVPVVFNKFPTAILAHGKPIVLPARTQEVDYEAELVIVIGRGGRHIARERAYEHVAGYCCGNDVSARDWQIRRPGGQWLLGKSFDTFAPIGPVLTTADEIPDPGKLKIQLRLNGRVMQDSTTANLIFPVDELIAAISSVCTLAPGDLIFTGTPSGVGFTRQPPVFLRPGDEVEVEIEKLGVLRNPVVAEE